MKAGRGRAVNRRDTAWTGAGGGASVRGMIRRCLFPSVMAGLAMVPGPALAHSAEQAFVLLLPTGVYTTAGVGVVVLTVLVASTWPFLAKGHGAAAAVAEAPLAQPGPLGQGLRALGLMVLIALVGIGIYGPRNPLENLLPLTVWTVWWIGMPVVQAVIGDLWHRIMPFTTATWAAGRRALLGLPEAVGQWPAVAGLVLFYGFLLADTAPSDPWRLAAVVAVYAAFTFVSIALFGPRWLGQGEAVTILLRRYAQLSPWHGFGRGMLGVRPTVSAAVFILAILGSGSFDGVNETFLWLGWLNINPLEFPGRSAVIVPTLAGLVLANVVLVSAFVLTVWLGLVLSGDGARLGEAFCRLSIAILPIALGYHIAHYLTSALVDGQHTWAALSDPLHTGADLLGIGAFQVTTGFFSQLESVRLIWLVQGAAVVIGHVWSVILGHAIALRMLGDPRRAVLSQIPLSIFMIAYTFFGLWLLSTPRV